MDQFAAMRAFVKVVETQGFSEAARQLEVAVSSVTRQVDALERSLNTQLLTRSTRSITLTPLGRKYYDKAVQILQDVEEANRSITEGDVPRGLLKVSLPVAFGRLHVAPLIRDFLINCPEVRLDLRLSDSLSNPVEEELDLIIRIGNLDRSGPTWTVQRLASYTRLVCGSPDYFDRHGTPAHPSDLSNHNCLLFTYEFGANIWQFQRDAEVFQMSVMGSVTSNHSEVLRQICLDGVGLVLMPTWLISEDIRFGRLQAVLTDFQAQPQAESDMSIYALHLSNRRHLLRVQAFIDFLGQRFGSPPYWENVAI